jgi:hypothetical protein
VMCGNSDDTIVAAHSNLIEHGKGKGNKADDSMVGWLCYRCHTEYDQGMSMSKQEKRQFIFEAIAKTYLIAGRKGFIKF